jgi:hypothetical protein
MICVKSILINRFRGIREGAIRHLADVNLLVGRNNSGKSTVVEAVHRVASAATGNPGDPLGRGNQLWSEARAENGLLAPEIWFKLDQSQPIQITAEVGTEQSAENERIVLTIAVQGNNHTYQAPLNLHGKSRLSDQEVVYFLRGGSVFRPQDARNFGVERALWQRIIGPRHDRALTAALNGIFNQNAESYSLLPDGKLWLLFPSYSVPLDSQGDGNRAALRCLILTVLRQTFFTAEEIECHQHPGSLTSFAMALCKLAKEQQIQLFLPTQSAECVRAFLLAARDAGSEAAVLHLKLDQGALQAKRLAEDAAQTLLDTGVDVRFLDLYG